WPNSDGIDGRAQLIGPDPRGCGLSSPSLSHESDRVRERARSIAGDGLRSRMGERRSWRLRERIAVHDRSSLYDAKIVRGRHPIPSNVENSTIDPERTAWLWLGIESYPIGVVPLALDDRLARGQHEGRSEAKLRAARLKSKGCVGRILDREAGPDLDVTIPGRGAKPQAPQSMFSTPPNFGAIQSNVECAVAKDWSSGHLHGRIRRSERSPPHGLDAMNRQLVC